MNAKIQILISVLLLGTIAGCQKDDSEPLENQNLNIIETNNSGCKNTTKSAEEEQQSIELKAVNENQLQLRFINAILNCCPGEIVSNAYI